MKHTILAIDDSLTLREFISRSLSSYSPDFELLLAKDAREGLDLATSAHPDLILLDFVLPDMTGDEVCRQLSADPATSGTPVLLMSSNADDIQRTQAEFKNVVKSIAKPFTTELLCASVSFLTREIDRRNGRNLDDNSAVTQETVDEVHDEASGSAIPSSGRVRVGTAGKVTPAKLAFAGDTSRFSLLSALELIEQDRLSGNLTLRGSKKPIQVYFRNGKALLATLSDGDQYLENCPHIFTPEQEAALPQAIAIQDKSGTPVFLSLHAREVLDLPHAYALCQEQSWRLVANAWTTSRLRFQFKTGGAVPAFAQSLWPFDGSMNEWCIEGLRRVGDACLYAMAWGDLSGIPAYTRSGYERIQQIPLNDEEIAFAQLISPTRSLVSIAQEIGTDPTQVQRILYRFLQMGILDYWPASLLQGA